MAEFALPIPPGEGEFFTMARLAQEQQYQGRPVVANTMWEAAGNNATTDLQQGIALRGQSIAQSDMGQGKVAIECAKMAWGYHHKDDEPTTDVDLLAQRAETNRVLGVTLLRPIVRHEYLQILDRDEATEQAGEARLHLDRAVRDSDQGQLDSLHLAVITRASIAESLYGDRAGGASLASYAGMAWMTISNRPDANFVARTMDGVRSKPDAARHALGAQTVAALMRTPHRARRTGALAVAMRRSFGL